MLLKAITPNSGLSPSDCRVGAVVQAHPATDTWMRGDRYGVVSAVGRKWITVRMTVSGRQIKFSPDNLLPSD